MILERRKLDKKRVTFIWLSPSAYFQVQAQLKTSKDSRKLQFYWLTLSQNGVSGMTKHLKIKRVS